MKNFILLIAILLVVPLGAEEIWLGMIVGREADSLIIVDGDKVYCPELLSNQYIGENNQPLDAMSVTFPFTASLVINDQVPEHMRAQTMLIKIHAFYEMRNGRLVEKRFLK